MVSSETTRRVISRAMRLAAYVVMPKYTVGSIVVARRGDEVLLVRKRSSPVNWGFPAGYLCYGEAPPQAAERELREETGITASIGQGDLVDAYRQPWYAHFDHVFLVAADGTPHVGDAMEIAQAQWWPVDALPPLAREAELAVRTVPDLLTRELPSSTPPYSKRSASPAP